MISSSPPLSRRYCFVSFIIFILITFTMQNQPKYQPEYAIFGRCSTFYCRECDPSGDRCKVCRDKYGTNKDGGCDSCKVRNCTRCNENANQCTECESGFYPKKINNEVSSFCDNCLFGCHKCDNDETCIKCNFLFDLNDKKKCRLKSIVITILLSILGIVCCALLIFGVFFITVPICASLKEKIKTKEACPTKLTKEEIYLSPNKGSEISCNNKNKMNERGNDFNHSQKSATEDGNFFLLKKILIQSRTI